MRTIKTKTPMTGLSTILHLNASFDKSFREESEDTACFLGHFIPIVIVEVAVIKHQPEVLEKGSRCFRSASVLPFSDLGPHLAKVHWELHYFAVARGFFVRNLFGENSITVVPAGIGIGNEL